MKKFLVSMIFLTIASTLEASSIEKLRYGLTHYIDTTSQRGFSFKFDYVKSIDLLNNSIIYSFFNKFDIGTTVGRTYLDSLRQDEISNFRYDIGSLIGFQMVTDIKSRLYILTGFGITFFKYSNKMVVTPLGEPVEELEDEESETEEENGDIDIPFIGFTNIFIFGIEISPEWMKDKGIFLELMVTKSYASEFDNQKEQQINTLRFYVGFHHDFELGLYE